MFIFLYFNTPKSKKTSYEKINLFNGIMGNDVFLFFV